MMEPYDSVQNLRTYAIQNHLPQGKTTEETLNTILEDLAKKSENKVEGKYRSELLSSASVVLMGLGKIKDPVRLYRNIVECFEKRGECIFTQTVRRALIRLQNDAISQGREREIQEILIKENHFQIIETLSPRLSISFLEAERKRQYSEEVFLAIFLNKDFTKERFLKELETEELWDYKKWNALLRALLLRRDITKNDLFKILRSKVDAVRRIAVFVLLQNGLTKEEFRKMSEIYGQRIIHLILTYVKYEKFPYKSVEQYLTEEQKRVFEQNLMTEEQPKIEKRKSTLSHIKGSRGKRRRTMLRMTKPLRA